MENGGWGAQPGLLPKLSPDISYKAPGPALLAQAEYKQTEKGR